MLGEVPLSDTSGDFDLQWGEAALGNRVPWLKDVVYEDANDPFTAYRILILEVAYRDIGYVWEINPIPSITFFGTETVKNVGTLNITCSYLGG